MEPQAPPCATNPEGHPRRIGVEIEFAGIAPAQAAEVVIERFGGRARPVSPHRLKVEGARWGDFTIELDAKYAHPDARVTDRAPAGNGEWERLRHELRLDLHCRTRELIGDVVAGLVPTEVVCPPVPWPELGELDVVRSIEAALAAAIDYRSWIREVRAGQRDVLS